MANRIKVKEAVDDLLLREGDTAGINRARYMGVAKDIHRELKFAGLKESVRFLRPVLKTEGGMRYVLLPDNTIMFTTVYVVDNKGVAIALVSNSKVKEDITDLSLIKTCGCDCGCSDNLCSKIRNYELIQTEETAKFPDGSIGTFTKTVRKVVKADGSLIYEITEPLKVYINGIHTGTRLNTREEHICKLEIKECGCVKDCESNHVEISEHIVFQDIDHDCGCPMRLKEVAGRITYNVSDDGNRLIFPSNFNHDTVFVRALVESQTKDITIPLIAKKAFMLMVKDEIIQFDVKAPEYVKKRSEGMVKDAVKTMNQNLSRLSLSDIYFTVSRNKYK